MSAGMRAISLGLVVLLVVGCSDAEQVETPPGLDPAEEVELVEVEPIVSDESFVWETAYQVEGLPPVSVGHASEEFLEDAGRSDDPGAYQCLGDASGSAGCAVEQGGPALTGLTFGGPDVVGWSWQFVPLGTVAVEFTDQTGRTAWQRPEDRLVIFPDIGDAGEGCPDCRLDAIDAEGEVVGSADVASIAGS